MCKWLSAAVSMTVYTFSHRYFFVSIWFFLSLKICWSKSEYMYKIGFNESFDEATNWNGEIELAEE